MVEENVVYTRSQLEDIISRCTGLIAVHKEGGRCAAENTVNAINILEAEIKKAKTLLLIGGYTRGTPVKEQSTIRGSTAFHSAHRKRDKERDGQIPAHDSPTSTG